MKYKKTNLLQLANTVLQKVKKEKLFNSQHNLLITFSGGQDSVFCLLVLFLLKTKTRLLQKRSFCMTWNRKKVLDFSNQHKTKKTLRKQSLLQIHVFDGYCNEIEKGANVIKPILRKHGRKKRFFLIIRVDSCSVYKLNQNKVFRFQKEKKVNTFSFDEKSAFSHVNSSLGSNYTLLWCHHFWQNDSFFTMEHVSKYTFCKSYAIYVFATAEKVLSEQDARNWRHKVMQRSALFLGRDKCPYKSVELYLNCVSITKPFLLTSFPRQSDFLPKQLYKVVYGRRTKPSFVWTEKHNKTLILEERKQSIASVQHARRSSALSTPPWSEQLCVQGHNKSDRAEAILFNVIKGTGMNGISTLQWKHTFFSACNSNDGFYPLSLDFFKEIRVLSYKPIPFRICGQKKVKQKRSSKTQLCVPLTVTFFLLAKQLPCTQSWALCARQDSSFISATQFWYNRVASKETVNSEKSELKLFLKDSHVKTLYYQLKYQNERI